MANIRYVDKACIMQASVEMAANGCQFVVFEWNDVCRSFDTWFSDSNENTASNSFYTFNEVLDELHRRNHDR